MNFYKRFIGDITAKTGGLSMSRMGAYDRLLDHYFSTEQPIAPEEVYSICRAMDKQERMDVDHVLTRFWSLGEVGYTQSKADEVIAKALPLIEAARANGRKGGRPKKENPDETQRVLKNNPAETQQEPSAKATQSQSQTSSFQSEEIPAPTVLVASPNGEAPPATVIKLPERRIPCPTDDLLAAFHEACPTLPRVMKLNGTRSTNLTARWREVDADSKFQSAADGVEIFKGIFARVHASDFLSGRAKSWSASFDWLIQSTNFLKVCEGHYDNGRRQAK